MRLHFSLLLIFIFAGFFAMAHTIEGRIISAETGEPVTGAVIRVDGTNYRAISGLDGSFSIKGITKADYTLVVTMVGFTTETRKIKADDQHVDINLRSSQVMLKNVEVQTTRNKSDDASARNIEKTADRVMNLVSARTIEISPDLTVAAVIQRVSGVTVERNNTGDGQYALLRGMDKRYNYTLVNSVKMPSPDNKNRFVPLDIFPAEMLERLEVAKSLTPEMEGDGIGGAVNLVMKDAPETRQLSANIASGTNTLFFDRPFYSYQKDFIEKKSPAEQLGNSYPAKPRDFSKALLDVTKAGFHPNLYGGLSFGDRFLHKKLGVLVAGTYQNSLRGSNSTDYPFATATSDASNLPVLTGINERTFSEQQTRAGVHAKLDYRFSTRHKLQWYNAFLDFQAQQVRDERKTNLSVGYDPAGGNYNLSYDRRFRYTHQQIINSTLKGEHSFLKNNDLIIDWSVVYAKAKNEVPENSTIHLAATVRNNIENPKSVVALGGAERRWEHNTDEDKAAYVNVHYHIANSKLPVTISAGGMYRDKQRTNYFNQYDFRPYDESKPAGQQNNLIEGTDWKKYSEISFMVYNPLGSTGDPLNYDASEQVIAGYLQGKMLAPKWEALAGVRVENTDQGYFLKHPVAGLTNEGNQVYTDILPSVNLKFLVNHSTNLRASYYRAINRPSFFEIVPYRIVNEELTEAGNPDLKHTVADNADIRYEVFPKRAEQFMAGIFYKRIMNPIEFGMVLQGQSSFYMPTNFGTATNYGLELDYTKFFHAFGIKLNYTYTSSGITTSKLFYYPNPDPAATNHVLLKNVDQKRRLAGQAAHVANATLLYKNVNNGIDAQLSLAYTGDRLYAVSKYLDNDIWQSGFVQVDASAEKKIGKRFVVFVKVSNLLNTPVKLYVKKENAANNKTQGYEAMHNGTMTRKDLYGQTMLAGLRVKF